MKPRDPEWYLKDARNTVWGMAFVGFIPTMVVLILIFTGDGQNIKWDWITFSIIGYSVLLAALAFKAGVDCGHGKKSGRNLALIPAILPIINFPLGTIFSLASLVKLSKAEFVDQLT